MNLCRTFPRVLKSLFSFENCFNQRAKLRSYYRPSAELMESRLAPAVATSYVDDNWHFVNDTDGSGTLSYLDEIRNDNDTINPGGVTAFYGLNGFGVVTSGSPAFLGSNPSFDNIADAIAGTNTGGTVNVLEGTYAEALTVNKALTLAGAQAGVDAQTRAGFAETILDDTANTGRTPLYVTTDDVIIDGFTVQGTTNGVVFGYGIFLGAGTSGSEIRNNIIQNNIAGLSLANSSSTNQTVIERNLFRNNNQPGPVSGTGIYSDQFNAGGTLTNVLIDNNTFTGNDNVAVLLGSTAAASQSLITISNNTMTDNGNAILLFNTLTSTVKGNTMTGSLGSQLVVGGGVNGLMVLQNVIADGATRGIRIGEFGGGGTNQNVAITVNSITGNAGAGLEIDSGTYTGTLDASENWWGTANGPTIASNPLGTGQAIVDPSGQVDYSPILASGADASAASGFQSSIAELATIAGSPRNTMQVISGVNNLQEGVDRVLSGGTVNVLPGVYTGDVNTSTNSAILAIAGAGPGQVTLNGNLTLDSNDSFAVDIAGYVAGTSFDQLIVNGTVQLGSATLLVHDTLTNPVTMNAPFKMIDNDFADAVTGTFNITYPPAPSGGSPSATRFIVNGHTYAIYYNFGTAPGNGNDVALSIVPAFIDDFNRPDSGTLGPNWTNQVGSFGISSQEAVGAPGTDLATVNGLNLADGFAQADVSFTANGQNVGLVARYSGPGDTRLYLGLLRRVSATQVQAIISAQLGSGYILLFSQNVNATGGTLRFEVVSSSLKLFLNGTLVAYAQDGTLTSGLVGLRTSNSGRADNFVADALSLANGSLPFNDNFQNPGPGDQLPNTWLDRLGNTTIVAGEAVGQAAVNIATVNGINFTNGFVQATTDFTAVGQIAGLVARYSGPGDSNMYLAFVRKISATQVQAIISRNVGGTFTLLSNQTITSTGGTLRFALQGSSLSLFLNGALVGSAVDTMLTSGLIGMRTTRDGKLDNFSADS